MSNEPIDTPIEEITIDDDDDEEEDFELLPSLSLHNHRASPCIIKLTTKVEPSLSSSLQYPSSSTSASIASAQLETSSPSPPPREPKTIKGTNKVGTFPKEDSSQSPPCTSSNESAFVMEDGELDVGDSMSFEPNCENPYATNIFNSVMTPFDILLQREQANRGTSSSTKMRKASSAVKTTDEVLKPIRRRRKKKPYWAGSEHTKPVTNEQPVIVLTRLDNAIMRVQYPRDDLTLGHNCKDSCKPPPKYRKKSKASSKTEPKLPILASTLSQTSIKQVDEHTKASNLAKIIDEVARNNNLPLPAIELASRLPRAGDIVVFRLRQDPRLPLKDAHSELKSGRILKYMPDYDLYEVQLFHTDSPYVPSQKQRHTTSKIIVDWSTVKDPQIVFEA